jgi:hypothetical protein
MFDRNAKAISLDIEASDSWKEVPPDDGVPWLVYWSNRRESEVGGRTAPNKISADKLSEQAVLLSGFYIFKRPESTSWPHSPSREQVPTQISQDSATRSPFPDGSRTDSSSGASAFSAFAGRSGGTQDISETIEGAVISTDIEEV